MITDKNIVWLGGLTAAVATGLYVFWNSPVKKNKKKKDWTFTTWISYCMGKRTASSCIQYLCPGLVNLGNTCFLNAILQSLASCTQVCNWLTEFVDRKKREGDSECLALKLSRTLKVLNYNSDYDEDSHSPDAVINGLRARRWYFSSDEQDAHEMFHVLTQTLDEETARYPGVVSLFENPDLQFQTNEKAITRTDSPLPVLPHREMEHPFRGLLASQLQCIECGYRNPVRYDHFDSLSLSIPQSVWGSKTLESLLQHYISAETVSNVECPGCGKLDKRKSGSNLPLPRSTFKKKLTIGKLPQCLCIHIQRTQWLDNGMPYKKSEYITYPEVFNMDNYIYSRAAENTVNSKPSLVGGRDNLFFRHLQSGSQTESSGHVNLLRTLNYDKRTTQNGLFLKPEYPLMVPNLHADVNHNGPDIPKINQSEFTYKLSAVVVHLGDVMSGHFVTYRRSPKTVKGQRSKDKWLYCSDSKVSSAELYDVLSTEAYMLIYERL